MIVWPSPFLFWTEVENHEEIKKILLPEIKKESRKEKYHTTPGKIHRKEGVEPQVWQCEVITSYFDADSSKELLKKNLTSLVIQTALKKFYSDPNCPVQNKPRKHNLQEIWFNVYEPGYWQEEHMHNGSTYSGIYLLELNEENTTVFKHYSSGFRYSEFNKLIYETKHIKEGNVILFPSEFLHLVEKCSNQRTTISFNIQCEL
jgi:hypothetical protein